MHCLAMYSVSVAPVCSKTQDDIIYLFPKITTNPVLNECMKNRNAEDQNDTESICFHSTSSVECLIVMYLCFRM